MEKKVGTMNKSFSELGVSELIIKSIKEMGFEEPTEVQHNSIPYILDKKDLIVMSKTGSGKTGAFGIPLLQGVDLEVKGPQALILTPTRELAVQVDGELDKMSKHLDFKTTAVYGQHNMNTEINELKKGASVITGTPGRVHDHIKRRNLKTNNIAFLVLDEADRMLDMGFFDQVVQIIKALPRNRVTLLFSATMPPEIQRICKTYMNNPITLELGSDTKTVDTIKQVYYKVEKKEKRSELDKILKVEQPDSCIIFCNTRSEVDWVQKFFSRKGYDIGALHGGNTQNSRMKTVERFKEGKLQIIVATDVAARGLHIDDLSLVVNYDVPVEKDSYVHRIGRTGRVGNSGLAITLVTVDDMWSFYEVEEHVGVLIEELELPTAEAVKEAIANDDSEWAKKRVIKAANLAKNKGNHRGNDSRRNERTPNHKAKSHHSNKVSDSKTGGYTKSSDSKNSSHKKITDHKKADHKKIDHKKKHVEHKPHTSGTHSHDKKPLDRTNSNHKHVSSKPVNPKVHTPKPKQREIDYRLEAKKLLEKNGGSKKPSILSKIFKSK